MVWGAEWSCAADLAAFQLTSDRLNHGYFQGFCRCQFWQNAGQAGCEQALAGTWRPVHQHIVAAGCRNLKRSLRRFLPLHPLQVGYQFNRLNLSQWRFGQTLCAFQMVEQTDQIRRSEHGNTAGPARL